MLRVNLILLLFTICATAFSQRVVQVRSGEAQYNITSAEQDTTESKSNERRVALIIGNQNYKTAPLRNAANDANDLASLLTQKDFEVQKIINGTKLEMQNAVRVFAGKIAEGAIGLFYYSGHGVQVDGENFIVPVDANFEYKEEVNQMCISVGSILRYMETSNNKLNIIILDACRNSPFKSFSRSGEKGMVQVDAPVGSIVAYSTAPGRIASDGDGRNGLYTAKLMKYMNMPGLKIEDVFKQVRIEVSRDSNNAQIPWESNALMGEFSFTP